MSIGKNTVITIAALSAFAAFGGDMSAQPARETPDWFSQGVIYQVQPRAFSPDGSLKGITAKIPYIKETGATILYLVPVFKMDDDMDKSFWSPRQIASGFDNPRNQYRISDYFHVDPEYGSDADLKELVAAAHRAGLKVLFDLVYFHCGPTAPVLKEHPEFTRWNADGTVLKGRWRFPQFDFRNRGLREYLFTNMTYLLAEFGCDGFRCDVGARIPLDFWCEARDRVSALRPDAVLLCEGSDSANQTKAFDADYGRLAFGELLASAVKKKDSARIVRAVWEKRHAKCAAGARFVNHYENHDIATDVRPRRETSWTHAGIDQTLVYMFTADGIPMLFNGNEFCEASADHSMFGRTPLDWSAAETSAGKGRLALVKRLSELRRTTPALTARNGKEGLEWLDVSPADDVTAFVRRAPGERSVLVVQNWRDKVVVVKVPPKAALRDSAAAPLISRGAKWKDASTVVLSPFGFYVGYVAP